MKWLFEEIKWDVACLIEEAKSMPIVLWLIIIGVNLIYIITDHIK
jgi:hypothetical protein